MLKVALTEFGYCLVVLRLVCDLEMIMFNRMTDGTGCSLVLALLMVSLLFLVTVAISVCFHGVGHLLVCRTLIQTFSAYLW